MDTASQMDNWSIEQQLDYLFEGAYFADEAEGVPAGGIRAQMRAELKAKLELSAKLRDKGVADWQLRAYIGADPTRTSLHIGHMVPVVRLRRIQRLGHKVIFLIGDYTAMIGDPTGQSKEREQLTHEKVLELSRFYTGQAHRLLDPVQTEIRYNGEWLEKLGFAQIAELLGQFPVKQILARQDFRDRLEEGEGLRAHELLYSIMQGYDAYALNCDVQVGGYDQHFNLLAGRVLQEHFQRKSKPQSKDGEWGEHPLFAARPETGRRIKGPHVMLTVPLLMGTDGRKMSKSWGNTVDVLDAPEDMFGKIMRISDAMLEHYIQIAVEKPESEKAAQRARISSDPMAVKKWIAHSITELYHGREVADSAQEHFRRTVQEKVFAADDIQVVEVNSLLTEREEKTGAVTLQLGVLIELLGLAPSKSEARRLIEQGAVKLNGEVVSDKFLVYFHSGEAILQVGKRKIVKLV
ncbi:tyrosine--tRNA ligase [bacterium]|nr:tyrosine--tRNA ligase [bacterium]